MARAPTLPVDREAAPLGPSAALPVMRGGRPLKRWRYVGVFDQRLMLCVGDAHVGPSRQTFWAVWDREERVLAEHTGWLWHRGVSLEAGVVQVRARGVRIDIELDEVPGVRTLCAHGADRVWTRKQGGVRARGTVVLGGRTHRLDARAVIDDTAGYHARRTSWFWAAGVGATRSGAQVAFNLVEGVNDPPRDSERSVWIDGVAHEPGPVSFATDLSTVHGGSLALAFESEAERARHDELLIVASDYRQPFGRFSGTLGPGLELAQGLGVMERHRARW